MQLALVAARADRGVVQLQLHREAWPITAYYWLYTRYALRVLHFSAFHYVGSSPFTLPAEEGVTRVKVLPDPDKCRGTRRPYAFELAD